MSREWKPGDVAMVEAGCWANRKVALRLAEGWSHANGVNVDGDGVVSVARPLVVIDPEDDEWAEALAAAVLTEAMGYRIDKAILVVGLTKGLAEFAKPTPPKPPEPTDPTARVTDRRENIWRLLADGDWVCTSGPDIGEYIVWSRLADERGPLTIEVAS
jgi:hypothetical protein